jgi:hypothetical protein
VKRQESNDLSGFDVVFLDDEEEVRRPLDSAAELPFERAAAIRQFPSYRGQRNYPGLYYAATLDAHVGFESWLERDEAMALDFDPQVSAFASQPFWLFWPDRDRARSHAPDFFARTGDGSGVVIDCRPADRVKPRDAAAFAATERACVQVGWDYRLISGHDAVWLANVRWLAGYRHRRYRVEPVASQLLEAFDERMPLMQGAALVGDPVAVLPMLFHLLWSHDLRADLSERLDADTMVEAVIP